MSSTIGQACLDALKTALGSVINFELTNEAASDKKGQVSAVIPEGKDKPDDAEVSSIEEHTNSLLEGISIEIIKANLKKKTNTLTILFKVKSSGASSSVSNPAKSTAPVKVSSGGKQSRLRQFSEEISTRVACELGHESLSDVQRVELSDSVQRILERFQNQAYTAGFQAGRYQELGR